jgi:ABC-type Fe3+/spermidine/putrescine transport system ATPase subunit
MERGIIAQTGKVEDIFQHPKSEFVARFIGIRNFFKGHLEQPRHQSGLKQFRTGSLDFSVLTDRPAGDGFVCIRSEDVTIRNLDSMAKPTSARNNFEGTIVDIVRASLGIEVIVDINTDKSNLINKENSTPLEIAALISNESVKTLNLHCGKKVILSFKASAVKYVEE